MENQWKVFCDEFHGAVSKGDYDYIPKVLDEFGVQTHIHNVAIKPGKPFYFGTKENKAFFGLPGNPISTFVCFEVFIKNYIYKCMGYDYNAKTFALPIACDYKRRYSERKEFVPAKLIQGENGIKVCPLEYRGSSMTPILPNIEVLMIMETGLSEIKSQELVNVRLI